MKYQFINEHRHLHAINIVCRVLVVARGEIYQWLQKPISDREQENRRFTLIRASYTASRGV